VSREFDPVDNRRRVLRLTPLGDKALRATVRAMEGT
jgi:DNA-binding MarR family transcriptional regulator